MAEVTSAARAASPHPLRPISFGNPSVTVERRSDGTIYLRPTAPLADYPVRITDRLHHWAGVAPDRVFMAERNAQGGWRTLTYKELLASSRRIASTGCGARTSTIGLPVKTCFNSGPVPNAANFPA